MVAETNGNLRLMDLESKQWTVKFDTGAFPISELHHAQWCFEDPRM